MQAVAIIFASYTYHFCELRLESGRIKDRRGMTAFLERFPRARPLTVGDVNTPLESFLLGEVALFG